MAKAKPKIVLNQYEAMFLFGSNFSADVDGAIKLARGIIEKHEGQVIVVKKWDERKLAYEISGQKRGLYIVCFFKAPGSAIVGIERDVSLSDQVMRVLVTKADHLNADEMAAVEPQPIQPREEKPSWDRPLYDERPERSDRDRGDRGGRGRPSRDEPAEAGADKD
jgi:small subunit ribosomal protein S6